MYKFNINSNPSEMKPMASIFDELINEGLSTVLGAGLASTTPQVNIIDEEGAFVLELAAPGLNKSDFHLHLEDLSLTISFDFDADDVNEKKNFIRREFQFSSFKKSFQLPEIVDQSNIRAEYENGVLVVTLPKIVKTDNDLSRTIEIK